MGNFRERAPARERERCVAREYYLRVRSRSRARSRESALRIATSPCTPYFSVNMGQTLFSPYRRL